jgi:hypothetical protein
MRVEASTLLSIADRFNAKQLRSCVLEYIFEHVQDVIKTPAFGQLEKELMNSIFVEAVKRANVQ